MTETPVTAAPADGAKKKKGKGGEAAGGAAPANTDLFSQWVMLCQNQKWREAALMGRKLKARALADDNEDLAATVDVGLSKIDYTLRRQMAAAAVSATAQLLQKEFLLDVG